MNTSPGATTVLCFGDSNTFGRHESEPKRYAANERWTGVLQNALGSDYYVIEEGLGGRTTQFDDSPDKPSRNGLLYFGACLESHLPLDAIVIMLGTNDLKSKYNQPSADIANSIDDLVQAAVDSTARRGLRMPRVLLVSPAHLNDAAPGYSRKGSEFSAESAIKSRQLAGHVEALAHRRSCDFLDAATVAAVGYDGIHLESSSHKALGEAAASILLQAFSRESTPA